MIQDTRHLRAFYAVCREGGVGRAAATLYRTQPAVSYQIRQLETQLGVQLFERGGKQLALTAAGRRLFEFCERFFGEYSALATALGTADVDAGALTLRSVPGFGRYVLVPALCGMQLPSGVDLRFGSADEVFASVEDARCDAGFVYVPRTSSRLRMEAIHEEELVLLVPPALLAQVRACRSARDFGALDYVTYEEGDYVFGRWFADVFGEQPAQVRSHYHFDELEEVITFVRLGHGVSIVPLDAARSAVASGDARVVRPQRRRCLNTVFVVTRASSYASAELERLCTGIRTRAVNPLAESRSDPRRRRGARAGTPRGARRV